MTAPILRALLLILQASHRAFANCDKNGHGEGWIMRPEDYAALNVALVRLASRLPVSIAASASLTLRAEIALDSLLAILEGPVAPVPGGGSQVHPDSALPSRTDFDTTEAQYVALASMRAPLGGCSSHCGSCDQLRSQCRCGERADNGR